MLRVGIADAVERTRRKQSTWERLQTVRKARSEYWVDGYREASVTVAMHEAWKLSSTYLDAKALVDNYDQEDHDGDEPAEIRDARLLLIEPAEVAKAKRFMDTVSRNPGIETGELMRDVKGGLDVYVIDDALLEEMRALEMDTAKDLGQLKDASTVNVNVKMYVGIDIDRV